VHTLEVPLTISESPPVEPDAELSKRLKERPPELSGGGVGAGGKPKSYGLIGSIGTAIAGGIISLLTPCVFPMIPITVSYFLKQAERRKQPAPVLAAGSGTGITTGAAPAAAVDQGPAPQ